MGVRYREYIASGRKYQNTTKKSGATGGGAIRGVYVSDSDLQKVFRDFEKIAKRFGDDEWRKEAVGSAAEFVAMAAQKRQKKSAEVHYYYQDDRRVKIKPGNLRISIQYLRKLKKTPRAFVGPNIKNKITAKTIGSYPANSSGFYAAFSSRTIRSAEQFRKAIMEPALSASTAKVVTFLSRKIAQQTEKIKGQLSLFK